jgi:flavin reductase (DIM6/NTAB) family NADH-FMN oxidoreductase RutF
MSFDFSHMSPAERFAVMTATIVPRPIALVTSLDAAGRLNVAPYSFFAPLAIDPPLLALGVLPHTEGRLKDTGLNVLETGELVVNLVSERLSQAMNLTCIDAPRGVDEAALAGLAIVPSERVAPPRIAESPVVFECQLHQAIHPGPNQVILLASIVLVHIAASAIGAAPLEIDTPALDLIGGMHGARWYTRTSDRFAMDRPTWDEWTRKHDG